MEITTEQLLQKIGMLTMVNDVQVVQIAQLEEKIKLLNDTITDMARKDK